MTCQNSANNQRFYATARATVINNGWRNKASVAVLGSAVLGFGILSAKEVINKNWLKCQLLIIFLKVYCDAVSDDKQRVRIRRNIYKKTGY